jgi:phosphopantothenoylcysteine decarboxylase/phosphopantothenate--cysteine ligase
VEDLDPVRFLSNRSSGKMGYAIARNASLRGAKVTLISGPVSLACPPHVTRIDVRSALEMKSVLWRVLGEGFELADVLVMAAAVGDFRFTTCYSEKLKRNTPIALPPLENNPDILAEIGAARKRALPLLIGFALETNAEHLVDLAKKKLEVKSVDAVVANLADQSLGRDDNEVTIVTANASERMAALPKSEVAARVLDWATKALGAVC